MNKKTKIAILGIIALVLVTIGITYAYWLITRTQEGTNVITTGCLDITLNGSGDITLSNQFPMSDEDGAKLTPYTFTVTNNCNTSVDYHINLESLGAESTAIDSAAIKSALNENAPKVLYDYVGADTTVANAYEAYTLGYGTLAGKSDATTEDEVTYSLRLWIDANAPMSEMNKTYTGKISVTIGQGISAQGTELASLILDDAEANNYLYTTTPDFSQQTTDGEYGIYSAADDYGISYYFRGDVENNYVKLGMWKETASEGAIGCYDATDDLSCQGANYETIEACETDSGNSGYARCKEMKYADKGNDMYWRIVRINGDGTIRLVYDGTVAAANGTAHAAIIGRTAYNESQDNAKYLGYTYDVDGVQTDSAIKDVVETWYENNLESDYGKYVADSIFCNDRQVTSTSGNTQYYGVYDRLCTNKTPKLSCTQDADKYTVSSAKGNGLLTKPIGLITADEVAMAGVKYGAANRNFYLYNDSSYSWTMSPVRFVDNGEATVVNFDMFGALIGVRTIQTEDNARPYGARPVINLKADVLFTGNGTIDSPYEIVME